MAVMAVSACRMAVAHAPSRYLAATKKFLRSTRVTATYATTSTRCSSRKALKKMSDSRWPLFMAWSADGWAIDGACAGDLKGHDDAAASNA